jgi:hypothetical protein
MQAHALADIFMHRETHYFQIRATTRRAETALCVRVSFSCRPGVIGCVSACGAGPGWFAALPGSAGL